MCSGRVDLDLVFKAFEAGHDGVLVGGCMLNQCNYVTQGNFDALGIAYLGQGILKRIGVSPERLGIEFMSGGDGKRLADVVNGFCAKVKKLGPLGEAEGVEREDLRAAFAAVRILTPYLKLVEREHLRVPVRSEAGYRECFASEGVNRLLDELIGGTMAIGRGSGHLRKEPFSTLEIAKLRDLSPSEVARHMDTSAGQSWVGQNQRLTSYYIDPERCRACMICMKKCPVHAIDGGKKLVHIIDQNKCNRCGTCLEVCPARFGAVKLISGTPVPPSIPEERRMVATLRKES